MFRKKKKRKILPIIDAKHSRSDRSLKKTSETSNVATETNDDRTDVRNVDKQWEAFTKKKKKYFISHV